MLRGNLDLSMFGELQRLKCNTGTVLVGRNVVIPSKCSSLECIRGVKLVLPVSIHKLNIQNCSFKLPIDINHDYQDILIECWDDPSGDSDFSQRTLNTLNFSEGVVCQYLYAERCTINDFVVGPLVRECFCYNGVINNMVFNCTKEKLKFEFEHNTFIYPRFLNSEGISLIDLKRSKIIDPIF